MIESASTSKTSPASPAAGKEIVVVSGMSGAGKSTALAALADLGFETVDSPPVSMLTEIVDRVTSDTERAHRVAIGLDQRSHGFSGDTLADSVRLLRASPGTRVTLLFLAADDETLLKRFTETRRRHPLSGADSVEEALRLERSGLQQVQQEADLTLDTSTKTPHEMRRELTERFAERDHDTMALSIISFGFKHGALREADILFDVRFLPNPYWEHSLREHTGLEPAVADFVRSAPAFHDVFEKFCALVETSLPLYRSEGRSYLSVGIGCTGGKHRSVTSAEYLSTKLRRAGYNPSLRHRDLPKTAAERAEAKEMQTA